MALAPALLPSKTGRASSRGLVAVVALALAAATVAGLVGARPVIAWDGSEARPASEVQLTELTNQSRAGAGRTALPTDPALVEFARQRSRDMAERGYFSHRDPSTGAMVFETMTAAGYCYRVAGENIGWLGGRDDGAEVRVNEMFLESPTHHAVLMGETWTAMGVGTFRRADGRKFWTVLFAQRCSDDVPAATAG